MNKRIGMIVLLMLLFAVVLSSCAGRSTFVASSWPGIALNDEALVVSAGNVVHVLDAATGDLDWTYPEQANAKLAVYAPAVFDGEQMILSGYDNQLHVTSAVGSEEADAWAFSGRNRFIDSAVVVDDVIYAANADRTLYALDMDGDELWRFETDAPLWAAPVYADGTLYQVSQRGVLYAVDAADGTEIWRLDLDESVMSSPAIGDDGELFVSTMANSVVAIDSAVGDVIWESEMDQWAWASPFYYDGFVYVTDSNGDFYAFDALSGELMWTAILSERVLSEPVVMNEMMFIGNEDGEIYSISFDGDVEKLKEVDGKILSTGVTDGSLLYFVVSESEENLLAIGMNDSGSLEWEYVPEN